jgi:hypothetical protein
MTRSVVRTDHGIRTTSILSFANGRDIVGRIWILAEKPVAIPEDVNERKNIDEEKRSRYSQSRKNVRFDYC